MTKFLAVLFILASLINYASEECIFKCKVIKNEEVILSSLKPVGGYTTDLNTACIGNIDGNQIIISSNFGYTVEFVIQANGRFISSITPEKNGVYILSNNDIVVKCIKH